MKGIPRAHALIIVFISATLVSCASLGSDPRARTPGSFIDDAIIERIAHREINRADERLRAAHIGVTSYNGVVLLTGQVENGELSANAQQAIEQIRKVRKVHNELQVAGPTSLVARSNDAWLTTKVKTKLIVNSDVDADRVKVVTEDNVVYLMGMVPREEANRAVDVARTVFGVQKIVKVFEYLD